MKVPFKKIKILQVITLSCWGGAPQVVYDLIKNLDKKKFEVELACGMGSGWEKMKDLNVKIYPFPSFKREISIFEDIKTIFYLFKIIKKNRYDIVHCHTTKGGFVGRISAKLAGVKKIFFTCHGWGFYNAEFKKIEIFLIYLERFLSFWTTKVICVSENDKIEALKRKIVSRDKIVVIKNGIEWKEKDYKRIINKKKGEIVFGMTARLAYQKNPLLFLRAAKAVIEKYYHVKFFLVGGGALFKRCKNFIEKNHLQNKIFMLGEKSPEETRKLLYNFDVFVLTSLFEGLPLSLIEAMFSGLPIIASNVGGVSELVINYKNGFLIKPRNLNDLVNKMSVFLKKPSLCRKMGKESRKIAKSNFTVERMASDYQDLYLEKINFIKG